MDFFEELKKIHAEILTDTISHHKREITWWQEFSSANSQKIGELESKLAFLQIENARLRGSR